MSFINKKNKKIKLFHKKKQFFWKILEIQNLNSFM